MIRPIPSASICPPGTRSIMILRQKCAGNAQPSFHLAYSSSPFSIRFATTRFASNGSCATLPSMSACDMSSTAIALDRSAARAKLEFYRKCEYRRAHEVPRSFLQRERGTSPRNRNDRRYPGSKARLIGIFERWLRLVLKLLTDPIGAVLRYREKNI